MEVSISAGEKLNDIQPFCMYKLEILSKVPEEKYYLSPRWVG